MMVAEVVEVEAVLVVVVVAYCGVQPAQRWYEVYRVLAHCLAYANSCMNPIIYSFVSSDFKRRFSDVVMTSQSCGHAHPPAAAAGGNNQAAAELPMMPRMRGVGSYEEEEAVALVDRRSSTPNRNDLRVDLHDDDEVDDV